MGDLEAAIDDTLFADPADGMAIAGQSLDVARQLATLAIRDAHGGDPGKLAEAEGYVAKGDALRADGQFKGAAADYKSAVSVAEGA